MTDASKRRRIVTAATKKKSVPPPAKIAEDDPPALVDGVNEEANGGTAARADQDSSPPPVLDTTLVANFTHQIVNPLNGVVGTLDNIIDGSLHPAKRDQKLRAARAQLQVAIELVRNLAYLSELLTQEGRDGLRRKASDVVVPKVILEAIQTLEGSADQKGIKLHLNEQETQYVVRGQNDLLRQVFLNLVENGIKYGASGSAITISSHIQKRTNHFLVEVASTGCVVAADERERIFERGVRGKQARDQVASGSGIGLFICRQILGLYDATIECESSASDSRTTFRLRFPEVRVDQAATEKVRHARKQ